MCQLAQHWESLWLPAKHAVHARKSYEGRDYGGKDEMPLTLKPYNIMDNMRIGDLS
jgi:hypothetical protein